MSSRLGIRRPVLSVLTIVMAALLGVTLIEGPSVANHAKPEPGPIHAGNTFGWYRYGVWRDEFKAGLSKQWKVKGPGLVRTQHGMLTLNTSTKGTVSATLAGAGHSTGRWEIRLRSRRYETSHTNYKVVTELVPAAGRNQHCGGQDIALHNWTMGSKTAKFYIHTLPNRTYRAFKTMDLRNEQWHTFAVEVTKDHISWFVDAHVINTERRKGALSGVPLTVKFSMLGVKDARMNKSRMQMDWVRYWSAKAPNKKSIKAPQTELSTYNDAC